MDTHITEVETLPQPRGQRDRYQAVCSCGRRDQVRSGRMTAEADAAIHEDLKGRIG